MVLEQKFGVPQVINDGVSIARAIELADPVENAGAQLIKEVRGKCGEAARSATQGEPALARAGGWGRAGMATFGMCRY